LYGLLSLIYMLGNHGFDYVFVTLTDKIDSGKQIPLVLWASVIASIQSLVVSLEFRYNWFNRLSRFLGLTKKYGDVDVWHYFNDSPMDEKNGGWVYIRDHKTNLTYYVPKKNEQAEQGVNNA